VGSGLFDFGDADTVEDKVPLHLVGGLPVGLLRPRLQHALGVVYHDGKLYVADTYNSKIKVLDPVTRTCKTFLGGEPEGWLATRLFYEPGGLSHAAGKLYVADTNAHRIRVVDLKTKQVSTLKLQGVSAPSIDR
jgi:DNA-binding beta-propeller fold protein YncE